MPEPNPDHLKAVLNAINKGPFFENMSIRIMEIGVGYSVVAMAIGRQHMNPFGGLHGGAYASAIDTAAYWSAYCHLPEESGLVSIDLKVDFLAPIYHGKVIINGQTIKAGKTIYLALADLLAVNFRQVRGTVGALGMGSVSFNAAGFQLCHNQYLNVLFGWPSVI